MARDLTTGMEIELDAGVVQPIILVSLALETTVEYLWSGYGTLAWNGQQWQGLGELGEISDLTESAETEASGASMRLNKVALQDLQESLQDIHVGRPVSIWFGFLDSNGQIVPDPALIRRARVDKPTAGVGTKTSTIGIALESRLNDWQRARNERLTSEDQKRRYPQDTGLDFVPQLVDAGWKWGN